MGIKKYTETNREAWNEVNPIHQRARKIDLKMKFKEKGFSTLDEVETGKLKEIAITGKTVAQLCCNNGRETLSLVNLGAAAAVGFDISDAAIQEAEQLADISGLNCRFVRTDVYDIGSEYDAAFDLIYITIGGLTWLPDLDRFFGIVSGMLKGNGTLMIYDEHPFTYMLATSGDDEFDGDNPLNPAFSYFREKPWIENSGLDYLAKSTYKAKTAYSFSHKLSDICNAIIGNGLNIKEVNEYSHDLTNLFEHAQNQGKAPLSYILIAEKDRIVA